MSYILNIAKYNVKQNYLRIDLPTASSIKTNGIPTKNKNTKYGIKNTPPPLLKIKSIIFKKNYN